MITAEEARDYLEDSGKYRNEFRDIMANIRLAISRGDSAFTTDKPITGIVRYDLEDQGYRIYIHNMGHQVNWEDH